LVTITYFSTAIYYLPGISVSLALYPHNVNKFVLIVSNFYVAKVLSQHRDSSWALDPRPRGILITTPVVSALEFFFIWSFLEVFKPLLVLDPVLGPPVQALYVVIVYRALAYLNVALA
jgi:hypothetical protein